MSFINTDSINLDLNDSTLTLNDSQLTETLITVELDDENQEYNHNIHQKYLNMKRNFNLFKECFSCLEIIKENEKLWIDDNDVMTIDESSYYSFYLVQSVNRFINNQNRKNLLLFIDRKFTEFIKFLDIIKTQIEDDNNELFKNLANDSVNLIDNLIPGLHTLKHTYIKYNELVYKLSSIILTFIDFKDFIVGINKHSKTIKSLQSDDISCSNNIFNNFRNIKKRKNSF